MRFTGLIAVTLLLAGCSHATVSEPGQTPNSGAPHGSTTAQAPIPSTTTPKPTAAPAAGAPIADVISWIEAGHPVDAAGYHSASRDGETTALGDDVAFTAGSATCMTGAAHPGDAFACVVTNLADAPPAPADVYGNWKGNWVDFSGDRLQVGSVHGDPGRFLQGNGPDLPDGATLAFGDYRCRTATTGLFCVNYAHRSAARFSPAGIEAFGCLRPVPPPADAGRLFSCAS